MPLRLVRSAGRAHTPAALPLAVSNPAGHGELHTDVAEPAALWRALVQRNERRDTSPGHIAMAELAGLVFTSRRLRAGQWAFLQGQASKSLYAVYAGSFKISLQLSNGCEQVSRFCFPGDLMGLDGLGGCTHASTATALEDSAICSMPVSSLHDAGMRDNRLHDAMYRQMGQEILREQARMLLLGSVGALGRLAAFLLEVSDRMRMRGYSPLEFHMRMSRADIGSYLCLRLETVSRGFSVLQEQGALYVDKRHIVIRSLRKLHRLHDRDAT